MKTWGISAKTVRYRRVKKGVWSGNSCATLTRVVRTVNDNYTQAIFKTRRIFLLTKLKVHFAVLTLLPLFHKDDLELIFVSQSAYYEGSL